MLSSVPGVPDNTEAVESIKKNYVVNKDFITGNLPDTNDQNSNTQCSVEMSLTICRKTDLAVNILNIVWDTVGITP